MKTIWKFPLQIVPIQPIEVPIGADFLDLKLQDDVPTLWMIVEDDAPPQKFNIRMLATGQPIDQGELIYSKNHLGTIQMPSGLVWHYFLQVFREVN